MYQNPLPLPIYHTFTVVLFIQLVPYHMHLYNVCNYHTYHLIKIVYRHDALYKYVLYNIIYYILYIWNSYIPGCWSFYTLVLDVARHQCARPPPGGISC